MNFVNLKRRSGIETAILKLQLVCPTLSTAVHTTGFDPTGNSESGSGEHFTVMGGCVVWPGGSGKCTGNGAPVSDDTVMSDGHTSVGPVTAGGGVVPAGDSQPAHRPTATRRANSGSLFGTNRAAAMGTRRAPDRADALRGQR
jgi:hypothetical protein